ncbi:two-component system response regulator [Candidatus Margulisiibacteriota bacterium]
MQGKRILLIDNNSAYIEAFKQSCRNAGALVDVVEDGLAGLDAARNNSPDAIVIDSEIPRCNGWIICRLLKFDKQYQNIPVILVSALGNEKELAAEMGADAFVEKNSGPEMVIQETRQLFNTES